MKKQEIYFTVDFVHHFQQKVKELYPEIPVVILVEACKQG